MFCVGDGPVATVCRRLLAALQGDASAPRRRRGQRKIIGAERRGGQAVPVEEVDDWMIGPAVAYGSRVGDLRAGDDDAVALDLRLRVRELAVFARDGKALQLAAAR